jgi:hypothetical protein
VGRVRVGRQDREVMGRGFWMVEVCRTSGWMADLWAGVNGVGPEENGEEGNGLD